MLNVVLRDPFDPHELAAVASWCAEHGATEVDTARSGRVMWVMDLVDMIDSTVHVDDCRPDGDATLPDERRIGDRTADAPVFPTFDRHLVRGLIHAWLEQHGPHLGGRTSLAQLVWPADPKAATELIGCLIRAGTLEVADTPLGPEIRLPDQNKPSFDPVKARERAADAT